MRSFWKQTAKLAAVGFALGLMVGLGFLSFNGIQSYRAQYGTARLALYFATSGLLGAVNMGTATIYSLERWGLLRCTLTHFVISVSSVCAAGFSMGWLDVHEASTLWLLAVCVVAYFIIWMIMFIRYRRGIRRINEALARWKSEQDSQPR